jgi:hypothetical protein
MSAACYKEFNTEKLKLLSSFRFSISYRESMCFVCVLSSVCTYMHMYMYSV